MRHWKVFVAALLVAGPAHDAAAEVVRSPGGQTVGFRVRDSTPPDYANARPLPTPRSTIPAPPQAELIRKGESFRFSGPPTVTEGSEGTGETTPETVPVNKALQELDAPPPPEFGGADKPYTTALARPANQDWNRVAGKIFFRQNGAEFVCSGALVKRGIVLTAAHCVAEYGAEAFFSNWTFIPAYQDGKAPFGTWSTAQAYVPNGYYNGSSPCSQFGVVCRDDVAVLILKPKNGKYPGPQTGWFGYATNGYSYTTSGQVQVTQLGYPSALNKGEFQIRTDAQGSVDASRSNNTVFGSLQTGGSSGGPVLVNFGNAVSRAKGVSKGREPNRNLLVGVTSWVGPDSGKEMGASLFTNDNVDLLIKDACKKFRKACD